MGIKVFKDLNQKGFKEGGSNDFPEMNTVMSILSPRRDYQLSHVHILISFFLCSYSICH